MASFNRVVLIGNLTRDPEVKYLPSGSPVATFSIAVNRRYTSKEGDKKEEVDFFDIETWNKTAEMCSEYLNKGRAVMIEGRLKQDRWDDESGNKRSKLKIVAQTVQFLSGRGEVQSNGKPLLDNSGAPPLNNSGAPPVDNLGKPPLTNQSPF